MKSRCSSVKLLQVTEQEVEQQGEAFILCRAILTADSLDEKDNSFSCCNCQQVVAWKGMEQPVGTHWISKKIICDFLLTDQEDIFSFDEASFCAKKAKVVINEYKTIPEIEQEQENFVGMSTSMPINVPMSLPRTLRNDRHIFEPPHVYAAKTFDEKSSLSSRPNQRKFSALHNFLTTLMECRECHKVIKTPSKMKRHMLVHCNSFEYKCECGSQYKTKDNLTRHRQKCKLKIGATTANQNEFIICDSITNSNEKKVIKDTFTSCNTTAKPKKNHKCMECLKTFHSSSNLSRHAKQHLPKVYSCVECSQIFTKWSLLQKHKKQVHKYKCRICDLVLSTQDNLKKHLRIHDVDRKLYGCTDCIKVFKSSGSRKVHYRTVHLNLRPYECHCGAKFGHKHLLQRHKSSAHNTDDFNSGQNDLTKMDVGEKIPGKNVNGENIYAKIEEKEYLNDDDDVLSAEVLYLNTVNQSACSNVQYEDGNDIEMATQSVEFAKLLTGYDFKNQSHDRPLACYFGGCHSRFYRIYDLERHISAFHQQCRVENKSIPS